MYAVVKTGGKQYRVAKDDVLTVEKLAGDAGARVELSEVLAMDAGKGLTVGAPLVDGARVAAEVLEQKKGDKVVIFKKKRRKNYRRSKGHRQQLTVIRITDVLAKGQKDTATAKEAPHRGSRGRGCRTGNGRRRPQSRKLRRNRRARARARAARRRPRKPPKANKEFSGRFVRRD